MASGYGLDKQEGRLDQTLSQADGLTKNFGFGKRSYSSIGFAHPPSKSKMFCVSLSIVANPTINNPAILNCLIFWPHIYGVFYLNVWKFGLSGVKICGVNHLDINTDLSALNVALVVVGLAPSWYNVFNTFQNRSIQYTGMLQQNLKAQNCWQNLNQDLMDHF